MPDVPDDPDEPEEPDVPDDPEDPEEPEDPEDPDTDVIAMKSGWLFAKLLVPVPAEVTPITGIIQYVEEIFVGADETSHI